jgi:hypothetical protein
MSAFTCTLSLSMCVLSVSSSPVTCALSLCMPVSGRVYCCLCLLVALVVRRVDAAPHGLQPLFIADSVYCSYSELLQPRSVMRGEHLEVQLGWTSVERTLECIVI